MTIWTNSRGEQSGYSVLRGKTGWWPKTHAENHESLSSEDPEVRLCAGGLAFLSPEPSKCKMELDGAGPLLDMLCFLSRLNETSHI